MDTKSERLLRDTVRLLERRVRKIEQATQARKTNARQRWYLRVGDRSVGGPYRDLQSAGRGARHLEAKGADTSRIRLWKLVNGEWWRASGDETAALVNFVNG